MPKKITFTIKPDGKVEQQVEGVSGSACESITRPIIEALGGDVLAHERTNEYYEENTQHQDVWGGDAS